MGTRLIGYLPSSTHKMQIAEFKFGFAWRHVRIVGIPVWGFLIALCFYGGFLMLRRHEGFESALIAAGGFAFGSWLAVVAYTQAKYSHAFRCRYTVTPDGIGIDDDGPTRFIPWSDFETAELFPLFDLIRLRSRSEPRPLALFLIKRGRFDQEREVRDALAIQYLTTGMGARFIKRWMP